MILVDMIGQIRRAYFEQQWPIKKIVRTLSVRTPLFRAAIGLLYAVPATIAGYHATLALAHIGVPSEAWREAIAVVGAVLVGGTALARVTLFVPPHVERRVSGGPASFPLAAATKDG